MESYIIGGLVGFAVGVAVQRMIIYFAVDTITPTTCDYCRWKKQNQWRWDSFCWRHSKKKDRHKR